MPKPYLNLRAPAGSTLIEQWLNTPRKVRSANWVYDEQSTYGIEVNLVKKYDGIIFIETTSPSHPTQNGWQTIARRGGL